MSRDISCWYFLRLHARSLSPMSTDSLHQPACPSPPSTPPFSSKLYLWILTNRFRYLLSRLHWSPSPSFPLASLFCRQLEFNISTNLGHYILPRNTHQVCAPLLTFLDNGNTNVPYLLSLTLKISFSFFFSISSSILLATKFYDF